MTTEASRPLPVLSSEGFGPLPEVDKTRMIAYESIRYVPGYPSSYVKAYASAYAMHEVAAERERMLNQCIAHIDTIDDGESPAYRHCQEA